MKSTKNCIILFQISIYVPIFIILQGTGISEEVFRQIETVQNRYDSSTAAAFRAVQKSGEMVVRTLDPRQFIRLASETAPKINIDTNVSFIEKSLRIRFFSNLQYLNFLLYNRTFNGL